MGFDSRLRATASSRRNGSAACPDGTAPQAPANARTISQRKFTDNLRVIDRQRSAGHPMGGLVRHAIGGRCGGVRDQDGGGEGVRCTLGATGTSALSITTGRVVGGETGGAKYEGG